MKEALTRSTYKVVKGNRVATFLNTGMLNLMVFPYKKLVITQKTQNSFNKIYNISKGI